MRPPIIRGQVWRVIRTSPDDPFLIDRTGAMRLATTDPHTKIIRISKLVMPPLFDKVYMHEIAHAVMVESKLTDLLAEATVERQQIFLEELLAWFLESHAVEVIDIASQSLGRPVCVDGACIGGARWN